MTHTAKVISITSGAPKMPRASQALRDGWGAPKNTPHQAAQQRDFNEDPRDAA